MENNLQFSVFLLMEIFKFSNFCDGFIKIALSVYRENLIDI